MTTSTRNSRQLAEAAARVNSWPTVPAGFRPEVEVAVIEPRTGGAVLSFRGVDESYIDVFAAQRAAGAMGVPAERVTVRPFPPLPADVRLPAHVQVLAESPGLRVV
jgi:hypothetical protein